MNQQRMVRMLTSAQGAIREAGLNPQHTELIGQLILASAIEEFGTEVAQSLTKVGSALSEVSRAIRSHKE